MQTSAPIGQPVPEKTASVARHAPLHFRANLTGSLGYVAVLAWETVRHLPRILRLAWIYRRRRRLERDLRRTSDPSLVFLGDNMDAIHGISVSAHRMARDFSLRGAPAILVGISHSRNQPGPRGDDGCIQMLPAACVQDLFGYEGQELAYPSVSAWCDILENRKVDVVEIESPGTFGLLALATSLAMGIPVVQNYRTDLLAYTSMLLPNPLFVEWLHWFIRSFLRAGGRVVVPSLAFQEEAVAMGIPRTRIHRVPRGVDLSRFQPGLAEPGAWQALGAPEGPVVTFLGRISREKGLETLAHAFRKLLGHRPDAVLGLIGEGPFHAELEAMLADTGRVVFAGELLGSDLPRLLASSTIMAFPSTTDTFGNAVVEALACGVPAIVSDQGGPREIVEDGVSGFVVPGDDPDALCDAMARLLDDSSLRERMEDAAIRRARTYDPDAANDAHMAVYRVLHRAD